MSLSPLSLEHTVAGTPRWVDTAGSAEVDMFLRQEETRRREDNALRVYRRRIASLQLERDLLKLHITELRGGMDTDRLASADLAREEGRREGRDETRRELVEQFTLLGTLEQEMRSRAMEQQREGDREILRFARWLAGKVLAHEPVLDGQALRGQIRRLLDYWVGETGYRFHLHPEDRRLLLAEGGLETLARESSGRLEWLASPEVPRGGCRLELSRGLVDAVPAEMLDEMLRVLEQSLDTADVPEPEPLTLALSGTAEPDTASKAGPALDPTETRP